MAKYQQYAEYKDSGVEWVDKLPIHWKAVSLRWISTIYAGGTPSKTNESYWEDGTIPWLNSGSVNQGMIYQPSTYITQEAFNNSSARWISKGSLVVALAGQGKTKGMVAQLGIDSTCNQSMAAISLYAELYSRYLFWWLTSNYQNIRNMAGGDLRDGLNLEHLGSIQCPLPSRAESTFIANFLDHETAKIDSLIEKQQQLIQLLKEKRQAVISHAVTKGLNPNVPMKDSGVEWLGDVPEHWTISRYKYCTSRVVVGIAEAATHAYSEKGIPIIRATNIKEEGININDTLYLKESFANMNEGKYLYTNDIITVRTGYPGISAVIPETLDKSHCFTNLVSTPKSSHCPHFLNEYLNSRMGKAYFALFGWGSAQKNISVPILQEFPIAHPELAEQKEIVVAVQNEKNKFNLLISNVQNSIKLMQERRTALISAAVTGKIDVQNWQNPTEAKMEFSA